MQCGVTNSLPCTRMCLPSLSVLLAAQQETLGGALGFYSMTELGAGHTLSDCVEI